LYFFDFDSREKKCAENTMLGSKKPHIHRDLAKSAILTKTGYAMFALIVAVIMVVQLYVILYIYKRF